MTLLRQAGSVLGGFALMAAAMTLAGGCGGCPVCEANPGAGRMNSGYGGAEWHVRDAGAAPEAAPMPAQPSAPAPAAEPTTVPSGM